MPFGRQLDRFAPGPLVSCVRTMKMRGQCQRTPAFKLVGHRIVNIGFDDSVARTTYGVKRCFERARRRILDHSRSVLWTMPRSKSLAQAVVVLVVRIS